MGFEFDSESGLATANDFFANQSYVEGYAPSQADAVTYKALPAAPDAEKYPHFARWHRHIASFESEFDSLPGDASKAHTDLGPATVVAAAAEEKKEEEKEEEEEDMFGSDEEEEDPEAARKRAENLKAYQAKKATKPQPISKTLVSLEVKGWDDETDMEQMEKNVRAIEKPGLLWGVSKFVDVGYGMKKLQINAVVEDDKVGVDDLQQEIEQDEDHVQATDVAAMSKL